MWDLPWPGMESMSPALAEVFLITRPPGKPYPKKILKKKKRCSEWEGAEGGWVSPQSEEGRVSAGTEEQALLSGYPAACCSFFPTKGRGLQFGMRAQAGSSQESWEWNTAVPRWRLEPVSSGGEVLLECWEMCWFMSSVNIYGAATMCLVLFQC